MDHHRRKNSARNMYSNYNQRRVHVECSPNQSKKYTLSTFPSSNRRNFEDSGKVLTIYVSEFTRVLQFSSESPRLQDCYSHWDCLSKYQRINDRYHFCMFTPSWDQFQSLCSCIKTFSCSPGSLIHLEKYEADSCQKIVCPCKVRAVADYITLTKLWLYLAMLTSLQEGEFGIFYYNICPCML